MSFLPVARFWTALLAWPLVLIAGATPALGAVRETRSYNGVASNGLLNSAANAVQSPVLNGGYTLGRIDLSGTLTSVNINTFASDAQILITAPNGAAYTFHPFDGIGLFTTRSFSGSIFISGATSAAGPWTLRFFEQVDNGGTSQVDSTWNITLAFTDEAPVPPAGASLGVVTSPGASIPSVDLPSGFVWYRFTLSRAVVPALGRYLDIRVGSSDPAPDTEVALFDAAGALIASDDDSGPGLLSQLSFGAGTRPPTGDGAPFDGRNGPLAAGTYYLAVGKYDLRYFPQPWGVTFQGSVDPEHPPPTASLQLSTNLQPGTDCFAPTVTQQPQDVRSSLGQTVHFATASDGTGTPTYRWRHNNADLSDNAFISGSGTPTLTITGVRATDGGSYTAVITNACGNTTTSVAALQITCAADYNGDGDIGTDADINAFFACLSGNCCATCGSHDFNGDGDVGTDQDIESFFRVLAGGSC